MTDPGTRRDALAELARLTDPDAALRGVRADERKRIAAAIEARTDAKDYGTESGIAWVSGWQQATLSAARIARAGGAS